ncbi:7-carboxy-7-deazaguanine synthase homolog [Waddlia chondrophila 2032/99]|nr:7-carboxy-7-deazaguanine synthase homolog [Waddlia chondrophila 2032/99]
MMIERTNNQTLRLIEIFLSIQGETSLTGLPTTFIRLASCNLRCTWCDTPYSFGKGESSSLQSIIETVRSNGASHVCITGGEPLLQSQVYLLMETLCNLDYIVSLETGGSLSTEKVDPRVITILDIKCPGSGMSQKNTWENLERLREQDEVKFVIMNREDYEWSVKICKNRDLFSRSKPPLFSPVHNVLNPQELIQWTLQDTLPVRINLQVHKWVWSPETKGV